MATNFDTSGLSGYAKTYAEARNKGASDSQAHDAASKSIGRDTYSYFDSSGSSGGGSGSSRSSGGTRTAKVGDNPFYAQQYSPKSNDYSSKTDFYKAANEYALSLLDPYNLPGTYLGDNPYAYVTAPQEGMSSSKDIIAPPTFEVNKSGNIVRTDYTQSGQVRSLIPNLGGYRQTGDGRADYEVGDTYNRQISPYSFSTRFVRGDSIGSTPSWYTPGAHQSWLDQAMDIAYGKGGDYKSLLPGDDWYSPYYGSPGGASYGSSDGGSYARSTTAPAPSPTPDPVPIAPRAEQAPAWEGKFWSDNIDIDAELTRLGHNPAIYTPEQKQAILAAMRQLQGGR